MDVCPLTGLTGTELVAEYDMSITSDGRLLQANVRNLVSRSSGLVFNATGARGGERGFYSDEYDLHSENALSEFTYFDQGDAVGIHDGIAAFLEEHVDLPERGRMLDIGCGKGLLLRRLGRLRPAWRQAAVEPSANARNFFAEVLPELDVFEGTFEESPFVESQFDLVLANGVLEHVPAPMEFLQTFRSCLGEGGTGFIGVPNFANNAADLFTFDHLNRFTQPVLERMFRRAGLETVGTLAPATRVPMWFIVRPSQPQTVSYEGLYERSSGMLRKHLAFIDGMFDTYERASADFAASRRPVVVYGTGAIGVLGTAYTPMTEEVVTAVLDDNPSVWSSQKMGSPVRPPADLKKLGDVNVTISANPCYIGPILKKVESYAAPGAQVFAPPREVWE